MNRWVAAVAAGAWFASSALGGAADLTAARARGSLRVLVASDEQPEMFALGAGGAPGLARELIEGFAALQRVKVEPVAVNHFEEIIPALLRGEGDVIIGIIDTVSRRRQIEFTAEVIPSRHVVMNRKPAPPVSTLEALRASSRVGVVSGTSWAEAAVAAGVPAAHIEASRDFGASLESLRSGKVAAIVTSVVDGTLAIRHDRDLQTGLFLGDPGRSAWGIRKGDVELRQALDEYLEGTRKTGTWSRLVVKYFGEDALSVLGRARKQ